MVHKSRQFKKGQMVSYNVVDETGAYNVEGTIVRMHKDGTFDVDTGGGRVDRRVEPMMVEWGEKHPIGVIFIKTKKRK